MRFSLMHVTAVRRITPQMLRVSFGGAGLADFVPVAADQYCKLFFAKPGQDRPVVPQMPADGDVSGWYQRYLAMAEARRPWMRTFTIRCHHPDRQEIDIDFALHGEQGGPASRWAAAAAPGDVVGMIGPAASDLRTPGGHDWRLLIGDETALPAIGALVESLPPGIPAVVYAEVADAAEEQQWTTAGDVEVHWLHRDRTPRGEASPLLDAVRSAEFREGRVFAWIAGEASVVRALRRHLVTDRGVGKASVAFAGYWRRDLAEDDPPTDDDTEDQAEVMAELAEQQGAGS